LAAIIVGASAAGLFLLKGGRKSEGGGPARGPEIFQERKFAALGDSITNMRG